MTSNHVTIWFNHIEIEPHSGQLGARVLHPFRVPQGVKKIPQGAEIGLGDSPELSRVTEENVRVVAPSNQRLGSGKP